MYHDFSIVKILYFLDVKNIARLFSVSRAFNRNGKNAITNIRKIKICDYQLFVKNRMLVELFDWKNMQELTIHLSERHTRTMNKEFLYKIIPKNNNLKKFVISCAMRWLQPSIYTRSKNELLSVICRCKHLTFLHCDNIFMSSDDFKKLFANLQRLETLYTMFQFREDISEFVYASKNLEKIYILHPDCVINPWMERINDDIDSSIKFLVYDFHENNYELAHLPFVHNYLKYKM